MKYFVALIFFLPALLQSVEVGCGSGICKAIGYGTDDTTITAIIGDDQDVTIGGIGIMGLNPNNSDPLLRTITLRSGLVKGQELLLVNVSATGQLELNHNSPVTGGNLVKLTASKHTFNSKWDNLTLRWSGNNWIQAVPFVDIQ